MSKRYHDWYKIQKDVQGWQNIPPDKLVADRLAPMELSINLDYCHDSLRRMLSFFECDKDQSPDFYVITDLELGKRRLESLFELYEQCYHQSRVGIYVAVLSYYLDSMQKYPELNAPYSRNIDTVFRQNFTFAKNIENLSTVIDYPLIQGERENFLLEGVNFIFVHPNVKYFLWKE